MWIFCLYVGQVVNAGAALTCAGRRATVLRVKDCHQCDASDSFHLVLQQWADLNTISEWLGFDVHFERQQEKLVF